MNLALDVLLLVGATVIFVRGTIFKRIRAWYPPLLGCAMCIGFWTGVAGSLILLYGKHATPLEHVRLAVFTSLFAHVAIMAVYALEKAAGNE